MSERELRRAALARLLRARRYESLAELRLALAAIEGFHVEVAQLSKDLYAIGAWREVAWTIKEGRMDGSPLHTSPEVKGITNARHTSLDPHSVPTFPAWDRVTGLLVQLDDRTFDAALHSMIPIEPPEGSSE